MKAVTDISGERFGRLTVLNGVSGSGGKNKHVRWHCRCDCGIEKEVRGDRLRAGKTRSCGCLMLDVAREMKTTHGMSNRPEYCAYMTAYHRCTNPNNKRWDSYGGRGIEFRFNSFEQFYSELGNRPDGLTLDRINNNGHYEPGNVRWASYTEQNHNQRPRRSCLAVGRA